MDLLEQPNQFGFCNGAPTIYERMVIQSEGGLTCQHIFSTINTKY